METPKRATVYFDADIHRALRLKAAAADRSISYMVNAAVKAASTEDADDAEDLAAIFARRREPNRSFSSFVLSLKRRGRI